MKKKFLAVTLAVALTFVICLPAFAMTAEEIAAVAAKAQEVASKYGITITYETESDGSPVIGTGALAAMDKALDNVTPEVVRQISSYWEGRVGRKITYSFLYSPFSNEYGVEVLGSFDESNAVIEIYLPRSSNGTFSSGDSPLTYVHELGHAFHLMCIEKYGAAKMEQEWLALNRGAGYNNGVAMASFDNTVFVTDYASTTYHEDVAETFAHAFLRNRAGLGFTGRLSADGKRTALGDKVAYVEALIPLYLDNTATALENYRKVYTAPTVLEWQGLRLSGDHMQFIGCSYPRYVLAGILADINVQSASSTWVREIGGWYVESTTDRAYLIFPGGVYVALDNKLQL